MSERCCVQFQLAGPFPSELTPRPFSSRTTPRLLLFSAWYSGFRPQMSMIDSGNKYAACRTVGGLLLRVWWLGSRVEGCRGTAGVRLLAINVFGLEHSKSKSKTRSYIRKVENKERIIIFLSENLASARRLRKQLSDLIAASICDQYSVALASFYEKYSVGPSIRPICTRCCFTITDMLQVCGYLSWSIYHSYSSR